MMIVAIFVLRSPVIASVLQAYYHKVKLQEIKWRIDARNYLTKIKLLELQENI